MSLEFIDGANLWEKHDGLLLPYAQKNQTSRGREQLHHPDPWRLPFQRDVGRIVNTASFRRLDGKMQVVSPEKGDHFRNRLTHTLEVVRISRDIARRLGLNEDLSEAIALAHDLGHPPFGHSGEEALRKIMQRVGKDFEHNEHSERIVKFIEELNLSLEVLDGLKKHGSYSPHMEMELVDVADEIAYVSGDLEDGLRGGFFMLEDLNEVEICREVISQLPECLKNDRAAIVRRCIGFLMERVTENTEANIKKFEINSLSDVQRLKDRVCIFSQEFNKEFCAFKKFLKERYWNASAV